MFTRLRLALSFLTVLPVAPATVVEKGELGRIAAFFPATGWLLGGLLLGGAWVAERIGLNALVTAAVLVAFEAWLTRGLHLDGFADVCDGLGGSDNAERRLAIMKDSATGAFGVSGLICLLLIKTSCLSVLVADASGNAILLAATPAAARLAMAGLAYKSVYPRSQGTGHAFVGKVRGSDLLVGGITALPIFFAGWAGLVAVVSSHLPAFWLRRKAHRAFGGVTGDVLGASCEMGEAAAWLATACFFAIMG